MKYLLNILAVLLIVHFSHGQDDSAKKQATDTEALVGGRRFEFIAESASPLRGRTIFLSPGYSFSVLPDSIISHLPYYGRAYQAPMDPNSAGIRFTSTDFSYSGKPRKRGWDIEIKPKDVQNAPQIYLSIAPNGHASLRITSFERQSISFNGYIRNPMNL